MNFNISFERQYSVLVNIPIFCFECPSCFQLQKNPSYLVIVIGAGHKDVMVGKAI